MARHFDRRKTGAHRSEPRRVPVDVRTLANEEYKMKNAQ
jgi:hypothetical protein